MKAMILAAGVGARLRPLTDSMPKALVEVGGVPMLERVARRLVESGVDGIVVNIFHFADRVADFISSKRGFGVRCEVSREPELLDTGGGLKKASWFFDDGKPFIVHNVDVLTELDLAAMVRAHSEQPALATLAVRDRPTDRPLRFDDKGLLLPVASSGFRLRLGGAGKPFAFDGIHVISPEIFGKMTETGIFSIVDVYRRLAASGEAIRAFRSDPWVWHDIGSAAKLDEADRRFRR